VQNGFGGYEISDQRDVSPEKLKDSSELSHVEGTDAPKKNYVLSKKTKDFGGKSFREKNFKNEDS